MGTLDIPRDYADGEVLLQSDLDNALDAVEEFVNVTKLNDDNLQNGGVTASLKFANGSITTAKIADSAVGTTQIADSAVTTAKIADSNVTTAKIADSNVTTAKIADSAVTTAKINDAAVTKAKLAALDEETSASTSTFSVAGNAGETAVTNASVSLTTTGRPVLLMLVPDGSTGVGDVEALNTVNGTSTIETKVRFYRDSTAIAVFQQGYTVVTSSSSSCTIAIPPSAYLYLDTGASAGTYTYSVKVEHGTNSASASTTVNRAKLIGFEV